MRLGSGAEPAEHRPVGRGRKGQQRRIAGARQRRIDPLDLGGLQRQHRFGRGQPEPARPDCGAGAFSIVGNLSPPR